MAMDTAPETRRTEDVIDQHGGNIADPYRWLEDVANPEVQQWMTAQDDYARESLRELPAQAALRKRCNELFYFDAIGTPTRRGSRLFYTRKRRELEKDVVYYRDDDADDGEEVVLFDPNAWTDDGSTALGVWVPSQDGSRVAYTLKANNADEAVLHVRDVASGDDLPGDVIPGAKYAHPSWLPDGSGFYYTRLPTGADAAKIPTDELPGHAEVCFHQLGTPPESDRVVRAKTGSPQTFLHAEVSQDGRWLAVYVQHGWNSADVQLADREVSDTDLVDITGGAEALFDVTVWKDRLFIVTDDGAPRYRIMTAEVGDPGRASWTELVAEDEATLESASIIGGKLVCRYLRDVASELRIFSTEGKLERTLELPGLGTVSGLSGRAHHSELFYDYGSFTEPTRIFRVELPDGEPVEWARVELEVETAQIVCEQVRYPSKDGTEVPMFILRRRDVEASGDTPTVLYGYGGFNVSLTPVFSPQALPWLEAGGIYAIANLRGGGEYGESWHRAGMLANKQNVFDDFIAAGEYLIKAGWTRADKLAIRGGSNGGLLVSAAMTQRPDLFRAVVCAVPLIDMLRYHLHGSGRTWIPEYGDPEDAEQFEVLRAYSPQQNVDDATTYPALLMLSADNDDRVDPMHARKFVAAIQYATEREDSVFLRVERNAGHTGADRVEQAVEQAADTYAFLAEQLGLVL